MTLRTEKYKRSSLSLDRILNGFMIFSEFYAVVLIIYNWKSHTLVANITRKINR